MIFQIFLMYIKPSQWNVVLMVRDLSDCEGACEYYQSKILNKNLFNISDTFTNYIDMPKLILIIFAIYFYQKNINFQYTTSTSILF